MLGRRTVQRPSKRWEKANRQRNTIHHRVANLRRDGLHQLTTGLATTSGIVVVEDLNVAGMLQNPPAWLQQWSMSIGTDLATGMREGPGWNVFAREDGVVYHTYSRTAPDRFMLVPYFHQLLDQVPRGRGTEEDFPMLRHDEY